MRGDQTTEFYSNLARTKEVNKVFKATGSVASLQLFIMESNIIDDLLVICNNLLYVYITENNLKPIFSNVLHYSG